MGEAMKGFVSILLGTHAILSILSIVALQLSASATQQASIAMLSAKRVAERNADAQAFFNHSAIDAMIDEGYIHCGCNLNNPGGLRQGVEERADAYFTEASTRLSDEVVVTRADSLQVDHTPPGGGCHNVNREFTFTYTVNTTSAKTSTKLYAPISQSYRLNVRRTPNNANPNTVRIQIFQINANADRVEDITVQCNNP